MISVTLLLHETITNINFIDTNHNLSLLYIDKFVVSLDLCKTKNEKYLITNFPSTP